MEQLKSPFVFLSYAAPDRQRVREIHRFLVANEIDVWLDEEHLFGGQRWELEIQRAVDAADLVVLLVSPASMDRNGFYHREMGMVLEKAQHRPHGRVFPIPVLLDAEMEIPERLADLQCIRLVSEEDRDKLLRAVRRGLGQQEENRAAIRRESEIDWSFHSLEEKWEGLPGYEAQISWPTYTSTRYPHISHVSDAIRADMQLRLANERGVQLDQQSNVHSYGEDRWRRTNTLSVTLEDPIIRHRVLTQFATVYHYWAGTLHGNHAPHSWVFVLDPLVPIHRLEVVFNAADEVFPGLQEEVRIRVLAELETTDPSETNEARVSRREWVERGTADWNAFHCFGFEQAGLRLQFLPYEVAPYSFGAVSVLVPYANIKEHLRRPYFDLLGLNWADDVDLRQWQPEAEEDGSDWWK